MQNLNELRIACIDEERPPRIRKEPYIDLFFKLSQKAPERWCDDFNRLASARKIAAKIAPAEGLTVKTWVRRPDDIPLELKKLQEVVKASTEAYTTRAEAEARAAAERGGRPENEGEQGRLNRIVAELDFGS